MVVILCEYRLFTSKNYYSLHQLVAIHDAGHWSNTAFQTVVKIPHILHVDANNKQCFSDLGLFQTSPYCHAELKWIWSNSYWHGKRTAVVSRLNLIQVRQRSEEVCFAEDQFKCWKVTTVAMQWDYEFSLAWQEHTLWDQIAVMMCRQHLTFEVHVVVLNLIQPAKLSGFKCDVTAMPK